MAIEQREGALERYLGAGGEDLSAKRRRGGLLRLPAEILRNKVTWGFGGEQPADVVTEWLKKRLRQSNPWNSKGPSAAMVEPEADKDNMFARDAKACEDKVSECEAEADNDDVLECEAKAGMTICTKPRPTTTRSSSTGPMLTRARGPRAMPNRTTTK